MEEYLLSAIATELKIIPSDLSKIYSSRTDIPFPEIEHKIKNSCQFHISFSSSCSEIRAHLI